MPEAVIGRDQAGAYVLTVDKDDVVQRTGVELGQLVGVAAGGRPAAWTPPPG